jgi:alkanesulfonate monooxygenase SsuD/methylene tetrahydromethanopterin reductase-like flavin-dependent oxidoreductase (luciferase family)
MPASSDHPVLALIVPPDHAPELILEAAHAAEAAGVEELWLWEDCFASSGVAPAAAILGATERLRVGSA